MKKTGVVETFEVKGFGATVYVEVRRGALAGNITRVVLKGGDVEVREQFELSAEQANALGQGLRDLFPGGAP